MSKKSSMWADPLPPPNTLLTTKQAARRLNVSESFLERDRWVGPTIRFIRVGTRGIRYRLEDLLEYVAKRTGAALGEPVEKV